MLENTVLTADLPQVVFFGPPDATEGSLAPRFQVNIGKIVENCCSLLSRPQLDLAPRRLAVATLNVTVRLSFGLSMEWTGEEDDVPPTKGTSFT
uniref:Uncharacterized protein n=1 Tax=Trichuris muris TaxID=70415 RepID=A0A5S6Q674_TRIMR